MVSSPLLLKAGLTAPGAHDFPMRTPSGLPRSSAGEAAGSAARVRLDAARDMIAISAAYTAT